MAEPVLGPISYLVVEFPGNKMTGRGFEELLALVDRGVLRILDLVFVRKEADGSIKALAIADLDHDGTLDLAVFEGATSGLIDEGDAQSAAAVLEPNTSAGILLFENRWATPFVTALRDAGAQLVAAGYVPQDELAAAAQALER